MMGSQVMAKAIMKKRKYVLLLCPEDLKYLDILAFVSTIKPKLLYNGPIKFGG